ncbi:MAG: glycosyltransferase family 4 protein [Acidobacteria bacterium]|nr:glycosyltransferase family 4 protein [Acidobacteriota bacterium]
MQRIKLTVVMTHPAQYFAPWFRYIAADCPELDLTVLYATQPTPEQQGVGFGRAFAWDVPLTEGYRCRVVRPPQPGDNVHSDHFRGVDVPEIADAIAETEPDVALLSGWHSITQVRALWACRRLKVPVLYRGDTNLNNAPTGWRKPVWETKTGFLLRQFAGYLAVGKRALHYLRHFGIADDRIFASPHCVDNDFFAGAAANYRTLAGRTAVRQAFGFAEQDFVVLFAGKLEPIKRPMDLIRALTQAGLLVAGAGPMETECRAEAERLGVRAVWPGFLNQTEIIRAFAAADCLVLPSESETWGLVINEALATGLPCIVSDRVGCAPDLIVPGETGEIFPMGNVAALRAAIERIRQRIGSEHSHADACRAKADVCSFAAATTGLLAACQAAVAESIYGNH